VRHADSRGASMRAAGVSERFTESPGRNNGVAQFRRAPYRSNRIVTRIVSNFLRKVHKTRRISRDPDKWPELGSNLQSTSPKRSADF